MLMRMSRHTRTNMRMHTNVRIHTHVQAKAGPADTATQEHAWLPVHKQSTRGMRAVQEANGGAEAAEEQEAEEGTSKKAGSDTSAIMVLSSK